MGKTYDGIDDALSAWVDQQKIFFVATAPLAATGLVNCSPKGLDTLRLLGPKELAWIDVGGSGIETVAHLKENGRIVIMMCAFEGEPRIVRFHGRGEVVERGHADFPSLLARFPEPPLCRSIIRVQVTRVSDSCGWGVPLYEYREQRDDIARQVSRMTPDQFLVKAARQNQQSIDGLPGLDLEALRRTVDPDGD